MKTIHVRFFKGRKKEPTLLLFVKYFGHYDVDKTGRFKLISEDGKNKYILKRLPKQNDKNCEAKTHLWSSDKQLLRALKKGRYIIKKIK